MLKNMSKKILMLVLSLALIAGSALTVSPRINAHESRSISLNGTVSEEVDGYLDSKALIVSTGMHNTVNYRITPSWSVGSANKVQVFIKLPSLTYEDGKYIVTAPDEAPSPMGIRGKVNAGNGWIVVGENVSDGGILQLEYVGRLNAGSNPAFDIELSSYTDGSDGVYGAMPEGITLEMLGWVSYGSFNDQADTAWQTPNRQDQESVVKLIVSNLEWSTSLEGSALDDEGAIPIWDRYQYASYEYTIKNDSDNLASLIEGFDVGFDINSNDIHVNGIIPFDINRYKYVDGNVVENLDINDMSGEFIGVPDQGGILIYDITHWDGIEPLSNPLPYRYTGSGSIMLEQSKGEKTQVITPDHAPGVSERKYLLKLPLSRQGFPDLPTNFKVIGITNVKFAQGSNWSKTIVSEREITTPTYDFSLAHDAIENDVVYGYETHFTVSELKNLSNVPVFKPKLVYTIDDSFTLNKVRFKVANGVAVDEIFQERFLSYQDKDMQDIVLELPKEIQETDEYQFFDVELEKFNQNFIVSFKDTLKKFEILPVEIEVYGQAYEVKTLEHSAVLHYIEKQASNDHLGQNTTYTEVIHEKEVLETINIVYPKEVKPSVSFKINDYSSKDSQGVLNGQGTFDQPIQIDYYLGTKNEKAENVVFKADLNRNGLAIHDVSLVLRHELFKVSDTVKVFYINEDDERIRLPFEYDGKDVVLSVDHPVFDFIVEMDSLTAHGQQLVSVLGTLNKNTETHHRIQADLTTYQPLPYDQTLTDTAVGMISITLPQALNPKTTIDTFYGGLKSQYVSYESIFDVSFKIDTKNVLSPESTYTIDLLKAEKNGNFKIKEVVINQEFVDHVVYIDAKGKEYSSFDESFNIQKIVIHYRDFKVSESTEVAHLRVQANIDMGSAQSIQGEFRGSQEAPYFDEKSVLATSKVTVYDTKTTVTVKGVNQVDEKLGVGNKYSVDVYRYWNRGHTYSTQDYTLDQGYKSLGGFTTSFVRPSATYANNDQTLTITTDLPEHFDLYYLKVRDDVKDYLQTVTIYRTVDGKEVVWKEVPIDEWQLNTREQKYWRINTALYNNTEEKLFESVETTRNMYEHPYYKSPWHEDVSPQYPITKVEFTLKFTRESENDKPQMAGTHTDVIEYMGRFYKTSKTKLPTHTVSVDEFGANKDQVRDHKHSINSLVGYSYARTSTGAHDNTTLSQKQILMGTTGEYKASINNLETFSVAYYGGHGPDLYTPAATEHDEWLQMRNSGFFHDTLIYEFTYPNNPKQNPVYNYDAQYFVIEDTQTLKYLDHVVVYLSDQSQVVVEANRHKPFRIEFDHDSESKDTLDKTILSLKKDVYPLKVEAYFTEIPGFGDNTSEIEGVVQDNLGPLSTVDIRIGGIVNGNQNLVGTTRLYRLQDDQKIKTQVHSSSAILKGITPKLNAQVSMSYDKTKVYDYKADGVTPTTSSINLNLENKGEADISEATLSFKSDSNFRMQTLKIPQEIFDETWLVDTVMIDGIDVKEFFKQSGDVYMLDTEELFDSGVLKSSTLTDGHSYLQNKVGELTVNFKGSNPDVRMYGSFSKTELDDQTLPSRMTNLIPVRVEGIWVDQSDSKVWDYTSKPSFVNKNTKASDEVVSAYTKFSVSAQVKSYQTIFESSGSGNQGEKPTLTHQSSATNGNSPRLYNRVAKMSLEAQHLTNDYQEITDDKLFYDEDTQKYVSYQNLAVQDTTVVLYRLKNTGRLASSDVEAGNLPIFNPHFEIVSPLGLKIKEASVIDSSVDFINDEKMVTGVKEEEILTDKQYRVVLNNVVNFNESVYILVVYETENDYQKGLDETQNKTMLWNAYARPEYTHGFRSYDSIGKTEPLIKGKTNVSYEGVEMGNVSNTPYRFSNPSKLRISSAFDKENISGQQMTLTVSNIENELLHSNTHLMVDVMLDEFKHVIKPMNENYYGGFELTEFPKPTASEGYTDPIVSFKFKNEWIVSTDYDENIHDLKDVNELRIDYGIVDDQFVAKDFEIEGIGHFKSKDKHNQKTYDISSTAKLILNHDQNSEYSFLTKDSSRVYKAIAKVELNLQAFDTKEDALKEYEGHKVFKHSYNPEETFYYKISLQNINHDQGLKTTSPYGKADFLEPVIIDKIPEYLSYKDVEIRIITADGSVRNVKDPIVTKQTISDLDVGGSQTFANNRHNDGYGLLSNAHPSNTTINPAKTINFNVVRYNFENEVLKRGERLEIIYEATARDHDLPFATYKDGRAVWAPFLGWYGNNNPVGSTFNTQSMDMASLLHDVGVTGNKGHELTPEEFLSNSEAWTHGGTAKRKAATNTSSLQNTYYDESANKEKSHKAVMNEEVSNDLHSNFSGPLDEVYEMLTSARVNNKKVKSNERIMWAQNGLQLRRAWLYGASEFRTSRTRNSYGVDAANFYEHDGSLNHIDIHRHGYTPYDYDDYTYAVQLHEEFIVRLHGANLGDRPLESGLKYTEILPLGISPYDESGKLLGITAYQGSQQLENISYEVIQTPTEDKGYRAPAQLQEASTYKEAYLDEIPYVVEVRVPHVLNAWFKGDSILNSQYVDIKLRVEKEIEPTVTLGVHKDMSVWYDELHVTPLEEEQYLEVYSYEYGGFTRGLSSSYARNKKYYKNDAIQEGFALSHAYLTSSNYDTYLSFEPYGMYIRGLNAQNRRVDHNTLVTGDQITMRKPTLRVWSMPEKLSKLDSRYGNVDDFDVNIYDEMIIHTHIENQQLETRPEYQRLNEGYNYYSSDNYNDDIWKNTPQTIGGARGSYFEPQVTITLPKGVAPVKQNGTVLRYYDDVSLYQELDVSLSLRDISGLHQSDEIKNVDDVFDTHVELVDEQFVLTFTVNQERAADVHYNQSLVISLKAKVIDNVEGMIEAKASSVRDVFTPLVSKQYTTGSAPSQSSKDLSYKVLGRNNVRIADNDRLRKDSTSNFSSNMGYLKISERVIFETIADDGVLGKTQLRQRQASLYNDTKIMVELSDEASDLKQVDPAGRHWYKTEVKNDVEKHSNPSIESLTAGDIHHSRFMFTYILSDFAVITENYRILKDGELFNPSELGFTVEHIKSESLGKNRQKIMFVVTPPKGELKTSDMFDFLWEVIMVDGYSDETLDEARVWTSDDLIVDSYVSVITDDSSVSDLKEEDFVIQDEHMFKYHTHKTDQSVGFNVNETSVSDYAYDKAELEIIKPQLEIRKNTLKPRNVYSNGLTGDNYFKSIDDIEFLINHAEVVGSGVKEFVVEDILPTHIQSESSIEVSRLPLNTEALFVSTGSWLFPEHTLEYIKSQEKHVDDYFKVFVYYSEDEAVDGYELEGWTLLNEEGTNPLINELYTFDDTIKPKKIRVVLKAMIADELLIPSKTRLKVDGNPETEVLERVTETDPDNLNITIHPDSVKDNSIRIGVRVLSDASSTLFIYNTAQAWTNYVADKYVKLDQSSTRSYLTPSRPVVNINHSAQYFKYDPENKSDTPYSWSKNTTINPITLPHLKFKAEIVNAEKSMWDEDENNAYEEDVLIDPFLTVQVPKVMESMQDVLKHVEYETIDKTHPLSDDYKNDSGLPLNLANGLWTWHLVRDDQSVSRSEIALTDSYTGPWPNANQNVLSFWFKGNLYPGDRIVVEYIGEVNAYTPGVSKNLKSIAMVSNNTGILSPLNSRKNQHNVLGYELDDLDFNRNLKNNDRLVFNEKSLFTYEKYDNFGKRKVVSSDLNKIGTISPEATPIKEGGNFTYTVTVDNSKDFNDNPYVYPIVYDVFPYVGDTEILNDHVERNSKFKGELLLDSVNVKLTGKQEKDYTEGKDYTVYVGPFSKTAQGIEKVEIPKELDQTFFESLNTPLEKSIPRDSYFVSLKDFKYMASDRASEIQSILVMFNDKDYKLSGDSQIVMTYDLKARINAPVWLQESYEGMSQTYEEFVAWNTFAATQKVSRFLPQESNRAGVYVTEQKDKTYLGNYVWNDLNYDGLQNEGMLYTDGNGRQLLEPLDGNDPGINGVKVTLRTPKGYPVDDLGQPIHHDGENWVVVDEETHETILDETFLKPIVSSGPLETVTENDYYGNAGYYTFSNIVKRDYIVVYEFPEAYDQYSLTTNTVFKDHKVTTYHPKEIYDVVSDTIDHNRLVAVSDVVDLSHDILDEYLMSFDIGIAHQIKVGGTIFKEHLDTLDGYKNGNEKGVEGYHIFVKEMDGTQAVDINGNELMTKSDKNGNYAFMMTPFSREYYFVITNEKDGYSKQTVVSPFIHNANPFKESLDNDAYTLKGQSEIRTNVLDFNLKELYDSQFKDRLSVGIGVYDKSDTATIGNRVWFDENKNGLQDSNEKGLKGQELYLEQYYQKDGQWTKTNYTQKTISNDDGYYYFRKVPTSITIDEIQYVAQYKVILKEVVPNYNITLDHIGSDLNADNNFLTSGKLSDDEYVVVAEYLDGAYNFYEPIHDHTVDLGLHRNERSKVSGLVFEDVEKTGINTHQKLVADDVKITLQVLWKGQWKDVYYDEGMMISPTVTNLKAYQKAEVIGNTYDFENLLIVDSTTNEVLEYRVLVSEIPLWYQISDYQTTEDSRIDSDFKHSLSKKYHEAVTEKFVLNPLLPETLVGIDTFNKGKIEHVDLGLQSLEKTRVIGDRLWIDENRNGLQDEKEKSLAHQEVYLYEIIDNTLLEVVREGKPVSTITDADGYYEFTVDLANTDPESETYNKLAQYVVVFNRQSHHYPTDIVLEYPHLNSDFKNLTDSSYSHSIEDVRHTLISRIADIATLDENGYVDYRNSYDDMSIDGGLKEYNQTVKIGGTYWIDEHRDGIKESLEPVLENRTVTLERYNVENQVWESLESTLTDADGNYEFMVSPTSYDRTDHYYLRPIRYRVTSERLVSERWTLKKSERDDLVNRVETLEGRVGYSDEFDIFTEGDITSLRDDLSMGIGIIEYPEEVLIGGVVWNDENKDGFIQDEDHLEGRVITLQRLIDDEWIDVDETTSDEQGNYEFKVAPTSYDENDELYLTEFKYRVISDRAGYEAWTHYDVDVDNTIRTLDKHQGYTSEFKVFEDGQIDSAQNDFTKHIGIVIYENLSVISGTYWTDTDKDGNISSEENTREERLVMLWKYDKELDEYLIVEETYTDFKGYYEFIVEPTNYDIESLDYLLPYQYRISTDRKGNELFTQTKTELEDKDNKISEWTQGKGMIENITLMDEGDISSVEDQRNIHIGVLEYPKTVRIGDRVTLDTENGIGIDGITLTLQVFDEAVNEWVNIPDAQGKKEAITDEDGYYFFEVNPLVYETDSTNYLKEVKYRTLIKNYKGYHLVSKDTSNASVLLDENDLNVFERTKDDLSLDFILTVIPEENVETGVNPVAPISLMTVAFVTSTLALVTLRKKRRYEQ